MLCPHGHHLESHLKSMRILLNMLNYEREAKINERQSNMTHSHTPGSIGRLARWLFFHLEIQHYEQNNSKLPQRIRMHFFICLHLCDHCVLFVVCVNVAIWETRAKKYIYRKKDVMGRSYCCSSYCMPLWPCVVHRHYTHTLVAKHYNIPQVWAFTMTHTHTDTFIHSS